MVDRINEAKQLFIRYGGSLFHMDREGELQRYRSFGVSREQEEAWMHELTSQMLQTISRENDATKLRVSVGALVDSMLNHNRYEQVPLLLDTIRSKFDSLDSFSQLLVAESMVRLIESSMGKGQVVPMVSYARDTVTEMIEGIIKRPIQVADQDQADALLRDVAQPQRILERATQCLVRLQRA